MDVQKSIVLLIGIIAVATLVGWVVRLMRGEEGGSCPGCGSCGKSPLAPHWYRRLFRRGTVL